jgi:hypothetical protein
MRRRRLAQGADLGIGRLEVLRAGERRGIPVACCSFVGEPPFGERRAEERDRLLGLPVSGAQLRWNSWLSGRWRYGAAAWRFCMSAIRSVVSGCVRRYAGALFS